MMNYEEFEDTIKKLFESAVEKNVNVTSVKTRKNNNTLYRGLAFQMAGSNLASSLYLEDSYRDYESGVSIADIFENLYHTYKDLPLQSCSPKLLYDLENRKEQIVYKLINYEKNKDLLKEIPHIQCLDLAIVFYLLLHINDNGITSMLIDKRYLSVWGINTDTLYSYAKKNTPKLLPAYIQSMSDVVSEIDEELVVPDVDYGMLMLSNTYKNLGAGCILYDNILKQLGRRFGESLYVIPSSIHECIILPKSKVESETELTEMICEINKAILEPDEVLADHPYYYDLQKDTLNISA
ncbi:MAG: DUF5688 family protein [Eubacteriales bacterium]|nr:DUF5688 family protein [Eubacteriales bacterium]